MDIKERRENDFITNYSSSSTPTDIFSCNVKSSSSVGSPFPFRSYVTSDVPASVASAIPVSLWE